LRRDELIPGTSVILIVNDTMRRDRVGIYGGRARTPNFDRFARASLTFENAYTQAPWTKPSVATLFTSLYPSQHDVLSHPVPRAMTARDSKAGPLNDELRNIDPETRSEILENIMLDGELTEIARAFKDDALGLEPTVLAEALESDVISSEFTTLAEVLKSAGFHTAAFVGNPWMQEEFGFAQGFDVYDDSFAAWDAPGEVITEAGLRWLDTLVPGQRFFLYLHYMDSHRPYAPLDLDEIYERMPLLQADDRPLTNAERIVIAGLVRLKSGDSVVKYGVPPSLSLLEMAYDRGIENFDRAFGLFLDGFSTQRENRRTAIVVTSDHGEALFTRGYGRHGDGLYEDEVAIPLAARLPGVSADGYRVKTPIGLIDVMPTLCSYLDVRCPESIFGISLLKPGRERKDPTDRLIITEGVNTRPDNRAVRVGPNKLLWQPQPGPDGSGHALYNLATDRLEVRNLLSKQHRSERSDALFEALSMAAREAVPPVDTPHPEKIIIESDVLERLKSLGYIN
jgi:arylsulfatase A-like enzyme